MTEQTPDVKPWPYCTGHPDCHAVAGGAYYEAGSGTSGHPMQIVKVGHLGPTRRTPGVRLCRSHALIKLGWAVGS